MQPADDDAELVAQARNGDAAAIGQIATRYRPTLVRFARSLVASDALADDIAQEVFARLGAGALPKGALRPWLYRIARNLCLDHLRHRRASPTNVGPPPTGFDAPDSTAGPATRAVGNERSELIRRALSTMPDEYREVLLLRHFEGLSREEIAAVLELSDAAVKGRLVRAAAYLREQIQDLTSGSQ